MNCNDAQRLIAAYVDGETDLLRTHWIRRHLRACASCAAERDALLALRAKIRGEVPRFAAPPALRARVLATLGAARAETRERLRMEIGRPRAFTLGLLAGCAATVLAWFVGTTVLDWRAHEDLAVESVTAHVRATLSGQRIQVASSNEHTVKPWLSARLDYSPPVRDLAQDGFALLGGRIDYLDRRPVATLVYRFRDHTIDVFVRPAEARALPPAPRTVRGFNVARASGSGMEWLAVSDASADVLASFVQRLAHEAPAS